MKILLDECTPRAVKRRLAGRDVSTVQEMGWSGVKNGALLTAADGLFDVFITTDKNLRHQQNLSLFNLAVVLLPSNQVPVIESVIPEIEAALTAIKPGDFVASRRRRVAPFLVRSMSPQWTLLAVVKVNV